MTDYAYVVCADVRYLPEVIAELNSLDFVGNKQDVHFFGYKIPSYVISQFDKLSYRVIFHNITEEEIQESHGLSEVVCRKRYWYASKIGKDYKAVCVLDADMVFVRDPILFFEIADKTGLVLCCGKEQNKVYDDKHHKFKGEWVIPEGFYNYNDLINCPLFVSTHIWGEALEKSYDWFIEGFPEDNMKCPDMDCENIALLKYGSYNRTIVLPGIQFIGTNEQMLKPYMRVVDDKGLLKTESGIQIFSFHGQYYHVGWRKNQLDNRSRCIQGYLKASGDSLECSNSIANGSMNLLYERFKKMLDWKIVIDKKNYRHPELNYGFLDRTEKINDKT